MWGVCECMYVCILTIIIKGNKSENTAQDVPTIKLNLAINLENMKDLKDGIRTTGSNIYVYIYLYI